jgi:hypothetical protein
MTANNPKRRLMIHPFCKRFEPPNQAKIQTDHPDWHFIPTIQLDSLR